VSEFAMPPGRPILLPLESLAMAPESPVPASWSPGPIFQSVAF